MIRVLETDEKRLTKLCNVAMFMSCFDPNFDKMEFFDDQSIQVYFPVPEGTPYANNTTSFDLKWVLKLGSVMDDRCGMYGYIYHTYGLLERTLTKDMFKEHSLFLLKESLKTFSPFSNKVKELLNKLEALE